jgi:hypothetical protein
VSAFEVLGFQPYVEPIGWNGMYQYVQIQRID